MAKKFFKQLKTRVPTLDIRQVSKKKKGTFISRYKNIKFTNWEQNN